MHTGGHREEDFDGFGAISNLDKSFPLLVDRLGMLHSYHGRNIQYIRPYEKLLISAYKLTKSAQKTSPVCSSTVHPWTHAHRSSPLPARLHPTVSPLLVCPGPPSLFYVFFAADLDNYFLRTNNNNIEQQQQQPAAALYRHILRALPRTPRSSAALFRPSQFNLSGQ